MFQTIAKVTAVLLDLQQEVGVTHTAIVPDEVSDASIEDIADVWTTGRLACDCARALLMQSCLREYAACYPCDLNHNCIELVSLSVTYSDGSVEYIHGEPN